jgi:hypothetical protein
MRIERGEYRSILGKANLNSHMTIEKDNGYAIILYQGLLKKFLPCNHTSSTGFCYGYATGKLGASNISVNSHSFAALPGFAAARNSFISCDL